MPPGPNNKSVSECIKVKLRVSEGFPISKLIMCLWQKFKNNILTVLQYLISDFPKVKSSQIKETLLRLPSVSSESTMQSGYFGD